MQTTDVSDFQIRIEVEPNRVILRWIATGLAGRQVVVHRHLTGQSWTPLASAAADASGQVSFEDRTVTQGKRYWYCLGIEEGTGQRLVGEIQVDVPDGRPAKLAILGLYPNPSHGELRVAVFLPNGEPIRLDLLDVVGRRLLSKAIGNLEPGTRVIDFGASAQLSGGVYFVRLVQGRHSVTSKASIIRP